MIGRYIVLFFTLFLNGCAQALLMSHNTRLPESPDGIPIRSATAWRQIIDTLQVTVSGWDDQSREAVLAYLGITGETRNISWVRTPRAKQEIYMSPNVRFDLLPATEVGHVYKILLQDPERLQILVVPPMDIRETMLPNIKHVGADF